MPTPKQSKPSLAAETSAATKQERAVRSPPASRKAPPALVSELAKSPRPGSRLAALIDLLSGPEGSTVGAMSAATGWQAHSIRGAIAGALKKTYGLKIASTAGDGARVYRIVAEETAV